MRLTDPDHAYAEPLLTTCAASLAATTTSSRAGLLLEGFWLAGERWSLGSLQNGIYRPRRFVGPAALTLLTAAHSPGQPAPYGRRHRPASGTILYDYRAGSIDQPDNSALRAAFADQLPLIYFMGVAPGQIVVVAPVYVTSDDLAARVVTLEIGLPSQTRRCRD